MTSTERHEGRYQRRKKKREDKRKEFLSSLPSYDELFTYKNLYDSFKKCKSGVMWKNSIQTYQINLPTNTSKIHKELLLRKWKSKGFTNFTIIERGKLRHIQSVHISERCIQRTLCDKYLVPALSHNLIHDNGASMPDKGIDFTIDRIQKFLNNYYKQYKTNKGYVLLFDFSNYFGSINHKKLYSIVDKYILDDDIRKLYHSLIDAFDGEDGLGLGSQVCQISAIAFPNMIDHYFKDKLGIKYYNRYMDDGLIISNSLQEINKYKKILQELCNELGIVLNPKKINICRIDKGFIFLKKKFRIFKNGYITIRLTQKTLSKTRQKYKRLLNKLKVGEITYKDFEQAYKSWRGSVRRYNNYLALKNIDDWYNRCVLNYDGFIACIN